MASNGAREIPSNFPPGLADWALWHVQLKFPGQEIPQRIIEAIISLSQVLIDHRERSWQNMYLSQFIVDLVYAESQLQKTTLEVNERERFLHAMKIYTKETVELISFANEVKNRNDREFMIKTICGIKSAITDISMIGSATASSYNEFKKKSAAYARARKKQPERRNRAKEELRAMGAVAFPKSRAKARDIADELRGRLGTARYPGVETIYDLICELAGERGNLNSPTPQEG